MIPGISERITKGNISVLRLHYSADEDKRPGTDAGNEWLREAVSGYPGGLLSPRWRKEMEIDYGALGGTKLFPDWERWANNGKIVIKTFDPVGYKLYGSYDHGWRHPSAYYVHGVGTDGQIITLWEFYADKVPVHFIARMIKGEDITTPDGRKFKGNPFAGQETITVADPSIWAEDTPMGNQTNKSTAHLFEMEKVYFTPGERGGDTTVAEWLHGYFWANPEEPIYRITTDCPKLIWELGMLRHKEFSPSVAKNRDQPEGLIDKDNHGFDSLKMFLKMFPPTPTMIKQASKAGTFTWWQKQVKREKDGLPLGTFYKRDTF